MGDGDVPDTARRTCDQDDLVLEFFRHVRCRMVGKG